MASNRFVFLIFIMLMASCTSISYGQEGSTTTVKTNPPGATVYLRGETDLVAHTPASLPSNISGRFRAEITRPGYETWKGELTFVPGSANNINIALSKKTRVKASLRSLFVPGWGQVYSGNRTRGYLFTGSVIVAATSSYLLDRKFDKKKHDYEVTLSNYNAATSIEDRIALKTLLDKRQRDAYNAETDRNTAFAIGVALWGYNLLDAILFFPEGEAYYPSIASYGDGAVLAFNISF